MNIVLNFFNILLTAKYITAEIGLVIQQNAIHDIK